MSDRTTAGSIDALLPPEMAKRAEAIGVAKAGLSAPRLLVLGALAGAFIAFGAIFATVAATGSAGLPYGVGRALTGLVFCLGLVLVIVGGAELFTGNNLIVMALASGRITIGDVLRNWVLVYLGNLVGAVFVAALVFLAGHHEGAGGQVGLTALKIANAKCAIPFVEAFARGVLCNLLVCLAVWLCFSARSTADKVLAILFPISAFVAAGFEHCVANMYFVPIGLFIRAGAGPEFWERAGTNPEAFAELGLGGFMANLLPVTLGNIVGGALLVGVVYWFVYLREEPRG